MFVRKNIYNFLTACKELYGALEDQGGHGMTFLRPDNTSCEDVHHQGVIHDTVFQTM